MTDIQQHYRHTIATVDESNRLQDLISELQNLPPEQKAEVISAVIGAKESGLSVIFGNGNNTILQPDVVVQINSASSDVVKLLTDAIAKCIYPS